MHHKSNFLRDFIGILLIFVEILISLILSIFLVPILLTLWIINELVRGFIATILHFQCNGRIQLVSDGADSIWQYQKKGNNRMCLILTFSKDPVDIQLRRRQFLDQIIHKRLPNGRTPYGKLTKTFICKYGYDCMRDDGQEFQIQEHVKIYGGGDDGREYITEDEFMRDVMPMLGSDMDHSKPQWEEIIVQNVLLKGEDKVQSARCFRYHHGYMDGASANLMYSHCMHDKSTQGDFPYVIDPLKPLRISKLRIFLIKLLCGLRASFTLLKTLYLSGRLKGRFVTNSLSGQRHYNWSERIEAAHLRRVKNTMKVSAPSVLATAAGSALRKLNDKYPSSSRGSSSSPSPDDEVMVGMINALLPYRDICLRNEFTLTHVPLPIGQLGWEKRMRKVDKEMRSLPMNPSFYLTKFLFGFFGRFPIPVIKILLDGGGNPISFSNVPFTNDKMNLWGSDITEAGGWPPLLTNTGMGLIIMRYWDHIRFISVADEACLNEEEVRYFLTEVKKEIIKMAEECSQPFSSLNPNILSVANLAIDGKTLP